jgi:aryl-alcohol dehydrogenase-like predicted oxidoreductase
MNLSHAYAAPPPRHVAETVLRTALDRGVTLFDTAALYGFGANEELVGPVLKPHRGDVVLASKCGIFRNEAGARVIDGRPETLRRACDDSLTRLQTNVIDLYYLHRGAVGSGAAGEGQGHRPFGSIRGDPAQGARRAPGGGHPERVLALDAQPGNRGARRLP